MKYVVILNGYPMDHFMERLRGICPDKIRYIRKPDDLRGIDLTNTTIVTPRTSYFLEEAEARDIRDRWIGILKLAEHKKPR